MLSLDPDRLAEEITRAEEFRRKHTNQTRAIVQRYVSNYFRMDMTAEATPENSIFAYVAYMLPELWYANPSVRVNAKSPIQDQQIADSMEQGLRAWLSETDFTNQGQQVTRDSMMGYGAMMVGLEPRDFPGDATQTQIDPNNPEASAQALRPFAIRIPPDQLVMDPRCESPESARYLGHVYYMDKEQLEADPDRWPADLVAKLTEQPRDDNANGAGQNERAVRYGDSADRKRVKLVDLWIPEHNMLLTLAHQGDGASNLILRQETYVGPPEGPYEVFGFYQIPGDPYPMGPIQPIMEQLEEMWVHQNQTSLEASSYKRIALVEAGNIEAQKAVKESSSGDVVLVKGLSNNVMEIELGGSPEGRLNHIMQLRERCDRTIGLSDAQRGRVQGKTATETDIVQGNVDTRTSYMRQRVQRHTTRVLRRVAWYMFFEKSIVMPVNNVDPQTGQVSEGTFLGGIQPGQEGTDWIDFHLDIEPNSMQHSDDQVLQQRAMELLQVAQTVGQMMPMMPQINWRYILNMFGESFNQKDLADLLINPAALQQFGQMPIGDPNTPLPPQTDPKFKAIGGMGGPPPQFSGNPGMGSQPPAFAPRSGQVAPPMGQTRPMVKQSRQKVPA